MKKRYIVLLFLLIGMVIYFGKVNAASDITSLPSASGTTTDKKNYWTNFKTSEGSKYIRGMRVTLLKTDGTQVGHSYNILAYDEHYDTLYDYENYVVLGTGCSKVQYLMGKSGCNVYSKTTKSGYGNPWESFNGKMGKASSLNNLFSYFNVPLKSYIENWKLDEIWQWAETDKLNLTDQKIRNLYGTLFGLTDDYIDNIASDVNLLNDLWIAIEPVSMITFNGKMYIGTSYELGFLGYVNWKAVNSAMGRVLPCAALTTGTIIQKYPDAPGVASGSYFNGTLNIVSLSEKASYNGSVALQTVCAKSSGGKSSDVLAEEYVTGSKGAGIGLVYFKDTVKVGGITCAEVNNGISDYTNFSLNLARTYQTSGLSGIYQLSEVKDGIKYTYNGQQKVADSQWYINECTCYGAYDAYKKAGNSVELYKLPTVNIKTIFSDKSTIFTNFTEQIKQYVIEKSTTNPNSVGTVTDWNYPKYERLACGHTEANCQEVNFKNANLINPYAHDDCRNGIFPWQYSYSCLNNKRYYQDKIDYFNYNCRNLPLYLDRNFTDSYIANNKSKYNQCFNIYQEFLGGPSWNIDYYQESGCVSSDKIGEDEIKYNCTPAYDVGTCINGDNVYYNDSSVELNSEDYWKYCVFDDTQSSYDISPHKWSDKTETLTYFDENISSDYCEVYCVENLTGAFNSETITVKAGQHFVWNNHSLSGNRTCRTKSVEWDQFEDDLEDANEEIRQAYVDWQLEILKQNAIDNADFEDDSSSCSCINSSHGISCCKSASWDSCKTGSPNKCVATGSKEDGTYDPCGKTENTCSGGYVCDERDYTRYGEYTAEGQSFSIIQGDKADWSGTSWCENNSKPTTDIDGKKSDYETTLKEAKEIVENMKACYTWDEDEIYNVDPFVKVYYDDNVRYAYEGKLYGKTEYTLKDDSICINDEAYQIKTCSENSCPTTEIDMKNCSGINRYVKMTRSATTIFSLDENIFRYVLKSNNLSINSNELSNYLTTNYTTNYIDIGYSNFPISYSTPDGIHGSMYNNGKLDLEYSHLGHLENGTTAIDTILSVIDASKYGNWSCEFEVYSELIPENQNNPGVSIKEGDINLIYRPIDLYNPFPDINARGRNTGSNWCYGLGNRNDCSNTNEVVEAYILNNRGVESHDVYSEEPMYTFILTPTIIQQIRKYNDNNSYAEYYGSLDNQTFNFECNTATGKTCISGYLSYLIQITDAKNQPGTCVDDQYRTYNNPDEFDGCRY